MKTFTKQDIYVELYLGQKFRATEWKEESYIHVNDGQIVDNDNMPFNLNGAKEDTWVIWKEPQDTNTLSKEKALQALYAGKRIKAINWDNNELSIKDGQIMLNDAEPFNIMQAKETTWVEVKEKKEELNEIAELKAMLQKVLDINNVPETKEEAMQMGIIPVKDGRSTEAQKSTNELLSEVYGVTTPKEIQEQFKAKLEGANSTMDIQKTVCEYIPYCWIGDRTLGTTSVYYSNMRKIIKSLENENYRDTGLSLFLPPASVYEIVQTKIAENKKEEIRNKNVFKVEPIKELIPKLKNLLLADTIPLKPRQTEERERAYIAYSYLTIVTGRRQVEILKTLKLTKDKNVWKYCGITKDREDGKCIDAYSLDNDFEFIKLMTEYVQDFITSEINEKINNKVRKETDTKIAKKAIKELEVLYFSEREINSKFNGIFSTALKRITGTSFKASDWRDIYAEMLWISRHNKENDSHIDKRDFKAKVLGHTYDNKLSATEHYDTWEAV